MTTYQIIIGLVMLGLSWAAFCAARQIAGGGK